MLSSILIPKRLQARIVAVYLGLLVVIQAASYWFIEDSVDRNARASIRTELSTGEKVFLRLLQQNTYNLEQGTKVLAADFGFRDAVSSGDRETVLSALSNHGERINAGIAIYTDAQFQPVASTERAAGPFVAAVQRFARQSLTGGMQPNQIEVIKGQPYQIVAVPVKAPQVIGWVGMGFPVGEKLLKDMRNLSGLDVVMMLRSPRGEWAVSQSSLARERWAPVVQAWQSPNSSAGVEGIDLTLVISGDEFSGHQLVLPGSPGQPPVTALLLRSVDQALAPYGQLKLTLLILTALGVAAFGVGGYVTARRITTVHAEPIQGEIHPDLAIISSLGEHLRGNYVLVRIADLGAEHDLGVELAAVAQARECVRRRHLLEPVFGIRAPADLDDLGRALELMGQRFDFARERGGEHERLALGRKGLQLGLERRVLHAV